MIYDVHAHASASLWFHAFATTVFVINRLPSSVLHDKSPFQLLFGMLGTMQNSNSLGVACLRIFEIMQVINWNHTVAHASSWATVAFIKAFIALI